MRIVRFAAALALLDVLVCSAVDCRSPEVVRRLENMAAAAGRREPLRGIKLQMLRRADRLLLDGPREPENGCPSEDPARSYLNETAGDRQATLLWTVPGSGNTFVRALIESSTGIYTGTMHHDTGIGKLMPGEQLPVTSSAECNKLSVIKSHPTYNYSSSELCGFPVFGVCEGRVARVVMVVRHPFSAAWADFQRVYFQGRHAPDRHTAALSDVSTSAAWFPTWQEAGLAHTKSWAELWKPGGRYRNWMAAYGDGSYLLLRFEDLVHPIFRHEELKALVSFIGLENRASDQSIVCSFSSKLSEAFHRPHHRRLVQSAEEEARDVAVDPVYRESGSAHEAWLLVDGRIRGAAWNGTLPYSGAMGYTINAAEYWRSRLEVPLS